MGVDDHASRQSKGSAEHDIRRLTTDSSLYERFKVQAPLVAQELSWDEPLADMLKLYADLAADIPAKPNPDHPGRNNV